VLEEDVYFKELLQLLTGWGGRKGFKKDPG